MIMKHIEAMLVLSVAGLLAGCSVGASSNTSSSVFTGSVSAGVPLADGTLIVTDSSAPAKTFTAKVLADGSYSVDTASGVAPFLFHAQGQAGSRAVDVFSASSASNGKVNISPLTSLVTANAAGQDCAVTACTPATFTAARLTTAAARVHTQMVPLLTQFGLAIADELDSNLNTPARTRKWVFFKHIAVGGYVISRDGPMEFIKDAATGDWRMAENQRGTAGAKTGKGESAHMFTPSPGASSYGNWLPFSTDSSNYPEGATLIVVSSSSIAPPVTLVYAGGDNSVAKMPGAAMVESVADVSFLSACPRKAGQSGSCIDVAQISGGGIYTATVNDTAATTHSQAINNSKKQGS